MSIYELANGFAYNPYSLFKTKEMECITLNRVILKITKYLNLNGFTISIKKYRGKEYMFKRIISITYMHSVYEYHTDTHSDESKMLLECFQLLNYVKNNFNEVQCKSES